MTGFLAGRSELWLRVFSAIVLLSVFLPILWIGGLPFLILCAALSAIMAYEWFSISGRSFPWLLGGLVYCAIPVLLLPPIRNAVAPDGLILIVFLFLTVWATDIAAYFSGRKFGGPKLLPKVSPKKTWSGAIGGFLAAMVIAYLYIRFTDELEAAIFVPLAGILSVFSQAGDLFESWMKRRFEVKDSSNLIPGHGGFLDRMDGLVTAAIPLGLYALLTL